MPSLKSNIVVKEREEFVLPSSLISITTVSESDKYPSLDIADIDIAEFKIIERAILKVNIIANGRRLLNLIKSSLNFNSLLQYYAYSIVIL